MRYRIIIDERIIIDRCPVQQREDLIPLNAAPHTRSLGSQLA
jgi:hypothetical protein